MMGIVPLYSGDPEDDGYDPSIPNQTRSFTYGACDILVANVDAKGQISWIADVPKRQVTAGGGGFNSYLRILKDGNLNYIYDEHRKNVENNLGSTDLKTTNDIEVLVPVVVRIDKNGRVSKKMLYDPKIEKAILFTFNGKLSNITLRPGEMFCVGVSVGGWKTRYRIGIIKI